MNKSHRYIPHDEKEIISEDEKPILFALYMSNLLETLWRSYKTAPIDPGNPIILNEETFKAQKAASYLPDYSDNSVDINVSAIMLAIARDALK